MPLTRYATTAVSLRHRAAYRAAISAISECQDASPSDVMLGRRLPVRTAARRVGISLRQAKRGGHRLVRHNVRLHNLAIYLAVTVFGIPCRAIAREAGVSEAQVRATLRQVEDEREEGSPIDRFLDELQLRVMA